MVEEEKGFIIKDRRSFDEEGDLKDEEKVEDAGSKVNDKKEPEPDDSKRPPLPEVNFNSLIFSLSSSALLHIGEIADPQTGEKEKDLPMAKHSIDIIAMLKEKTKGNLDNEEQKFIDTILSDLRLRYVKALKQ
jgi:hypothetical protein